MDARAPDAWSTESGPPLGDGVFWRLEERPASLRFPSAPVGCATHEGGTAVVEVVVSVETDCERDGPVSWTRSPDGSIAIRAHVWVEVHPGDADACPPIAAIGTRHVQVPATEGELVVVDEVGGTSASSTIGRPPLGSCRGDVFPGESCIRDCDCDHGLRCIPALGEFSVCSGGRCARACDPIGDSTGPVYERDLACGPNETCDTVLRLASPTCRPREVGCADECVPGMSCPPIGIASRCAWNVELSPVTRVPCASEADCVAGLHCVEHMDGARRCEIPCFVDEMECPPMHVCDRRDPRWVCERIGE